MLQNGELEIVVDSHSKELSEAADKVSQWLWLRRLQTTWGRE